MIATQPFEVTDFSGGVTDYYIGGAVNKARRCDNLLIVKHGTTGKLKTRQGSEIYDADYYQIPAGNQRIGTLRYFEDTLLIHSKEKLHYINAGWQTLTGPSGNQMFPSTAATTDILSMAEWNKHLLITSSGFFRPQKLYPNASNTLTLRTAGLPDLASAPTCTPGAGGLTYLYAFVYSYTYTVGTVTYEDVGPVTQVTVGSALEPSASTIAITNIPALANGTDHNYDTASADLKIKIYRTIQNGSTFYFVGSVNNGTTTYNDTASDTSIQTAGVLLYTEGGVVENEPPPLCKLVHVDGDIAYWGHIKDGTEIYANRLIQGIPGDIDAVCSDFYVDIEDEMVGLSSYKGSRIVLGSRSVYRVDGTFDLLGRGGMFATKISDTADCISSQSVVQTVEGVFWAGSDGVYWSDGYNVRRLNQDYDKTWASWVSSATQKSRIVGKYHSKKNRIWWTIQTADATDCDKCYVLDLNWGLSDTSSFTTMSGTNDSFAPTALEFDAEDMIRADRRGYLFRHEDELYSDPKVDTALTPDEWQTTYIPYDYTSCAFNFGTSFEKKWIPRIDVTCENETNLSLQITGINDDNAASHDLKPVRFRGNMVWGDPDVIWGDPDLDWNLEGIIDEQRRFPGAKLRCQYKQIQLTPAFVAIVSSDTMGTATVSSSAHTATLTDAATKDWPTHVVDHYIAFETDDYTREYLITERTSADVVTFTDATSSSPNTSDVEWVIRGYPRGEILSLIGYVIHFAVFGKTQDQFKTSGTGEVGAS